MAKQRFGINDGYCGTVGTVIGYLWRGKWCLRSRPRSVRNPRTVKQQSNRLLFKQMVALAGSMKTALRKGLHKVAMEQHITECNYFVKYNRPCFSQAGDGIMAVEWENLMVSDGTLAAPLFETPGVDGASVSVPFSPCAEEERASGDDEVYLYAHCPAAGEGMLSASAWRRTGLVRLTLPEAWQGKEVHLYGFAVNHRGESCPTTYIGSLAGDDELLVGGAVVGADGYDVGAGAEEVDGECGAVACDGLVVDPYAVDGPDVDLLEAEAGGDGDFVAGGVRLSYFFQKRGRRRTMIVMHSRRPRIMRKEPKQRAGEEKCA